MAPFKDITGKKFGRLTAICLDNRRNNKIYWKCRCECGTIISILSAPLTNGHTKSCGCWQKDNPSFFKHGLKKTVEYNSWVAMKQRCYYLNNKRYKEYGGRGITVCNKWKDDFLEFLKDMGNKPSINHTLERKDVNGNYEPNNCIWLEKGKQPRNTTRNVKITINDVTMCLADWCDYYKVDYQIVYDRYRILKWPPNEKMFLSPKNTRNRTINKAK